MSMELSAPPCMARPGILARRILLSVALMLVAARATAAPANDNFASAQSLGGSLPASASGNNSGATLEADEWAFGGCSVWYSWTCPSSGWVAVDTIASPGGSQLDTVLAVFVGNTLLTLDIIGCNDEAYQTAQASRLVFYATAGTTYRVAVFGYNDGSSVAQGAFEIHLSRPTPGARVSSLTVSPATANISSSEQVATVTLAMDSDSALLDGRVVSISMRSPDGWLSLPSVPLSASDLVSGSPTAGTYKKNIPLPKGMEGGKWIPSVTVEEAAGAEIWSPPANGTTYQDHWIIPGNTASVNVTNTNGADTTPPALSSFSVSPAPAAPFSTVTLLLSISDNASGFHRADIWLANGGQWLAAVTPDNRSSGDSTNGTYEVTFSVPSNLTPGSYPLEIWLSDAVSNYQGYDGTRDAVLSSHPLQVDSLTVEGWRINYFGLSGAVGNAADFADPDRDGVPNLIEYALGGNPNNVASAPRPVFGVDGASHITLTFTPQVTTGLTYTVETSSNLVNWSPQPSLTGLNPGTPFVYTDPIDLSSAAGKRFLRLRVSSP